jgi:hypothetical protein
MLSLISEQLRFVKLKEHLCQTPFLQNQHIEIIYQNLAPDPRATRPAIFVGCEKQRANPFAPDIFFSATYQAPLPYLQNCIDRYHVQRIDYQFLDNGFASSAQRRRNLSRKIRQCTPLRGVAANHTHITHLQRKGHG